MWLGVAQQLPAAGAQALRYLLQLIPAGTKQSPLRMRSYRVRVSTRSWALTWDIRKTQSHLQQLQFSKIGILIWSDTHASDDALLTDDDGSSAWQGLARSPCVLGKRLQAP